MADVLLKRLRYIDVSRNAPHPGQPQEHVERIKHVTWGHRFIRLVSIIQVIDMRPSAELRKPTEVQSPQSIIHEGCICWRRHIWIVHLMSAEKLTITLTSAISRHDYLA